MLTIFSIPKPFRGHIGIIQTNAIRSWLQLSPACEIILLGDDEGVAEVAAEFGIRHIPGVARNEYGTPLLNSVFETAQRLTSHALMVYSNADIILMSDFVAAVQRMPKRSFLMVGQRWDVELKEPVNFDDPEWEAKLRVYVTHHGGLHPPAGSDYFVFPRGVIGKLPAFAVGRPGWDNWLIYHARLLGMPVIDATKVVTAIHQNHDFTRIPTGEERSWRGLEVDRNLELVGGWKYVFTLVDATHVLTPTALEKVLTRERLRRQLDTLPVLHPRLAPFWKVLGGLLRPRRTIRAIWDFFKT